MRYEHGSKTMMSKKCKYALKALRCLSQSKLTVTRSADIANKENIPKKFLETILLELKTHGFVGSKQGKEGGYFLLKNAQEIKISEVYRLFDGAIALLPCASEKYYQACDDCTHPESCRMRLVFTEIRNKTYDLLSHTAISDLQDDF